jgi:hypothetical protein
MTSVRGRIIIFLLPLLCASLRAQPALRISKVSLAWPEVAVSFSLRCDGEAVTGTSKMQLSLEENGTPVHGFRLDCPDSAKRCNSSAALLFDASSTMKGANIAGAIAGGHEYVAAMEASDEASIFRFAEAAAQLQSMTSDKVLLNSALQRITVGGATSVWDACITVLDVLAADAHNPCKALVLLTDGWDSGSRATPEDVIALANARGIRVFTIGIGASIDTHPLSEIARRTGGRSFAVLTPALLGEVYQRIAVMNRRAVDDCTLRYTGTCIDGGTRALRLIASDVCGGSDTATFIYVAPDNTGRNTPIHLQLADVNVPARETANIRIGLADSLRGDVFPPIELALRFDAALLTFKQALIPATSILPPGPVLTTLSQPGLVHLRVPSRSAVNGPGVLLDVEFTAGDPKDTTLASVLLDRCIFDDGCFVPTLSTARVRISPCLWKPAVTPNGSHHLCTGDTLWLRGEAGFVEYVWYRDSAVIETGSQDLRVTQGGRYRLIAKDAQGCRGESMTVDVYEYGTALLTAGNASTTTVRPGETFTIACHITPPVQRERVSGGSADLTWSSPFLTLLRSEWAPASSGTDSLSDLALFTLRAADTLRSAAVVPLRFSVQLPQSCIGSLVLEHPTVLIDGHCEKLIAPVKRPVLANAPNPFSSVTSITVDLPEAAQLRLAVLDAFGREVARLADGRYPEGRQVVPFDGSGLPAGMYVLRAIVSGTTSTKTMLIVK